MWWSTPGTTGTRSSTAPSSARCASASTCSTRTRARYVALAVFMEDERIPYDVLGRYWGVADDEVAELVAALADRSLVAEADATQGYVRLHDLQRELLEREAAGSLARWHSDLLWRCGGCGGYWRDGEGQGRLLHHIPRAFGGDAAAFERLVRREMVVLLREPHAIFQLASQQPEGSAVYRAWSARPYEGVRYVHWRNKPQSDPCLLTVSYGNAVCGVVHLDGERTSPPAASRCVRPEIALSSRRSR